MLLTVNARCFVGVVAFTVGVVRVWQRFSVGAHEHAASDPNCYRPLDWRQHRQIAHSSDTSINGNGHLIERHNPGGHEPELVIEQRHRGISQ